MAHQHIAIFTLLSSAHIYPVLGICSELVNRGYRVTFATTDEYASMVSEAKAEPIIFKPLSFLNANDAFAIPSSDNPNFWQRFASLFGPSFFMSAAAALPQLQSFYTRNPPDLILYDRLCFVGEILASKLGCAVGQLWPNFATHDGFLHRKNDRYPESDPMRSFWELADSFLSAYGVPKSKSFWRPEIFNICFVPLEFHSDKSSFDESYCFVGPCVNRPRRASWINTHHEPVILVSGSSIDKESGYFSTMLSAFSDSPFRIVLSLGESFSEDMLGAVPANFEINRHAYNLEVLPHAALTICQSGMGTVLESLYYGVPVIAIPRTPVHAAIAYRVEEMGLGAYLTELDMTADRVKHTAVAILNDLALLARVKNMQQIVRNSGGESLAADRIDLILNSRLQ